MHLTHYYGCFNVERVAEKSKCTLIPKCQKWTPKPSANFYRHGSRFSAAPAQIRFPLMGALMRSQVYSRWACTLQSDWCFEPRGISYPIEATSR